MEDRERRILWRAAIGGPLGGYAIGSAISLNLANDDNTANAIPGAVAGTLAMVIAWAPLVGGVLRRRGVTWRDGIQVAMAVFAAAGVVLTIIALTTTSAT